jgi:RHS repeat-associated protein
MVALNKTYQKTLTPDRSAKDSGLRFYSPEISRWLSRDPIGEMGGLNVYRFVANRPVFDTDSLGMLSTQEIKDAIKDVSMSLGAALKFSWAAAQIAETAVPLIPFALFSADIQGTYPYQHCVSSCRATRTLGREMAEFMGDQKEELDNEVCDLRDIAHSYGIWCEFDATFRKYVHGACNSADQQSDVKDNEIGRQCAECRDMDMGWAVDLLCEECCEDRGVCPDTLEGEADLANKRPFGPRAHYTGADVCPGDAQKDFPK